jgi:hypothetical protein
MYQFGKLPTATSIIKRIVGPNVLQKKCLVITARFMHDNGEFSGSIHSDYENAEKQEFLANPQIDWAAYIKPIKIQFWMLMEQL